MKADRLNLKRTLVTLSKRSEKCTFLQHHEIHAHLSVIGSTGVLERGTRAQGTPWTDCWRGKNYLWVHYYSLGRGLLDAEQVLVYLPYIDGTADVDKCMNKCVLKNADRKWFKFAKEEDIQSYIKQCPSITLLARNTLIENRDVITAGGQFPNIEYWKDSPL